MPCSHRVPALMLPLMPSNQFRIYWNFDTSVDADTDAKCEWCNWNQCIPFKRHREHLCSHWKQWSRFWMVMQHIFGVTALFSIRPVSLASSQHCRSADAYAQCKQALIMKKNESNLTYSFVIKLNTWFLNLGKWYIDEWASIDVKRFSVT